MGGKSLLGFALVLMGCSALARAEAAPPLELDWIYTSDVPAAVQVGDRLELRISEGPEGAKLNLSSAEAEIEKSGFVVQVIADQKIQVTPLRPGDLTLPSLQITGKEIPPTILGTTKPFKLTVTSAIAPDDPNPKEPVPPKPPVSLAFPIWAVVGLVLLILALVALVIYGLVRWSRKRRELPQAAKPKGQPLPEDEVALAALRDLEREALFEKGQFKNHYFKVSEIFKAYLGARYDFDAPESTTQELLAHLKNLSISDGTEIRELLEALDLVKFTDHLPSRSDSAWVLEQTRRLISKTKRVKQTEPHAI